MKATTVPASNFLQVALATLLLTSSAFGQFDTATVLGTVRDSSKLPVAGSSVNLTNVLTGVILSTTTNDTGDYQFVNVKIGRYKVSAQSKGFKQASASEFSVSVNARQRVDLGDTVGRFKTQAAPRCIEAVCGDVEGPRHGARAFDDSGAQAGIDRVGGQLLQ